MKVPSSSLLPLLCGHLLGLGSPELLPVSYVLLCTVRRVADKVDGVESRGGGNSGTDGQRVNEEGC